MIKVAVFGSGNGSNFEAICQYFKGKEIEFTCISDKKDGYILERAKKFGIKALHIPFSQTYDFLKENSFDLIVLAGYMRILPKEVVELGKFINIHPSLLPAFKGKDVIERAYNAGVQETGVTIHWVNEEVDSGEIIAQVPVKIEANMSLKELESKIHEIEHQLYPKIIENVLFGKDDESENKTGGKY